MQTLTVALDWTPNINHIGLYVAKAKGWYHEAGIDVVLANPANDNYALTPAKKMMLGQADIAMGPSESVISLNTKPQPVAARAFYAILQQDLSSIAVLHASGIQQPAQLDGKIYASYKARYEDKIVQQMVINDGGRGALNIIYPDKLGIWNTLLTGQAHATWIFDHWEGVEASLQGILLHRFRLQDFGIPYSYSPVLFTTQEMLTDQPSVLRAFTAATRRGYLHAQQHPTEAAALIAPYLTPYDLQHNNMLTALQQYGYAFGNAQNAGVMRPQVVSEFVHWLIRHQLETAAIAAAHTHWFSNALLLP
ncbi:MAG: ABC transporter substrate-binding protein [Chitinophagaceae bacterium]|nr:ABC transporter substrate-binding protein [Chitinophagaceae bacterium]